MSVHSACMVKSSALRSSGAGASTYHAVPIAASIIAISSARSCSLKFEAISKLKESRRLVHSRRQASYDNLAKISACRKMRAAASPQTPAPAGASPSNGTEAVADPAKRKRHLAHKAPNAVCRR